MSRPDQRNETVPQEFIASLRGALDDLDIILDSDRIARMARHFAMLIEANRLVNVTRITAPIDAAVKHYADSLSLLACPGFGAIRQASVLDVGTGGGFPAVPLAIARPDWQVTAVDGTRKKVDVVARAAHELGLSNLTARHARGRELAGEPETYDLATFRAVSDPMECLKEARRLVADGGCVVCYVTATQASDMDEGLQRRAARLGFAPQDRWDYVLRLGDDSLARCLLLWRRC